MIQGKKRQNRKIKKKKIKIKTKSKTQLKSWLILSQNPLILDYILIVYQLSNQCFIKKKKRKKKSINQWFPNSSRPFDYWTAITIVVCQNLIFDLYRSLALLIRETSVFPFSFSFFNKSFLKMFYEKNVK